MTDGDLQIVVMAVASSTGGEFRTLNDDFGVWSDCESAQASVNLVKLSRSNEKYRFMGKEVREISRCFVVPPRVLTKVVPVPVPLSVPGRFGSKFPVNYGSSVLYGS